MADQWEKYAAEPERSPGGADEWAKYAEDRSAQSLPASEESQYPVLRAADAVTDAAAAGIDKTAQLGMMAMAKRFHIPPEALQKMQQYVAKPLGYLGGVGSTAAVQAAKALVGKGSIDPVIHAVMGDAKSAVEQLRDSGWNRSAARVVGVPLQMASDPLTWLGVMAQEGTLAEMGNGVRNKLVRNAFSPVDQAYGELEQYSKRLGETPFSDQILKDNTLAPSMTPGKMKQAIRNQLDETLGDKYNDIWARNDGLRITPNQILNHPKFKQWADREMRSANGAEAVEAVKEQIHEQHKHQTMEPVSTDTKAAIAKANQQSKKLHIENKRAQWTPNGNSLDHQEFDPSQALSDFQPLDSPDVAPKADPGMDPDLATYVAKDMMDTARGKQGALGDIQNRWGRNVKYKQGMKSASNALRDIRDTMVSAADPEAEQVLEQANKDYGTYSIAEKPFNRLMTKEANRRKATALDSILAVHKWPYYAAKKAVQYPQTPSGALRIGNAAKVVGESGIWEKMMQLGLINDLNKD